MKSYEYKTDEGITIARLKVGEKGVTQELIDFLIDEDRKEKNHVDYASKKEVTFDGLLQEIIGTYDSISTDEQEPELRREEILLRSCIDKLSEEQQRIYYLVMGQRKTYEEIAKSEGRTKQAVFNQMERIKNKLRKMLEEMQ